MLSEYQLEIADLYNIPTGNVKKLLSNLLDKEKYVIHYENLKLYLRLGLKLKKMHRVLEFNQAQCLKPYIEFNTHKIIEAEKSNDKDGKALYKLINNAIYAKIMENLRNRIDVKLVNNDKDYLKCTSKPSYVSHKIFEYNLVAIYKNKLALKFNKPAYIGMCSKVLMYEIHQDYIKNKYDSKSKLLFTETDSLMYEIKTEDDYGDFSGNKEMFDFSNYSTKSKYHDNSNKLVIGKIKDETGGVAIEGFVGLKPKMYSFLEDNKQHKTAKGVNKNILATIGHNEYKDVLLKNNCLGHSVNRVQCKDHRIGTYKINKISLPCFGDKIYIQSNGYDGLALGYQR